MTASTKTLMTVIGVLWTERGISYDRLCRDYDIDPQALDDIRTELVDVKRIARDVNGLGLAWIGAETIPHQQDADPLKNDWEPALGPDGLAAALEVEGDSQRRQLTIMFCDIVGSTSLAERHDPEDMREILQKFRDHCEAAITEYGGRTATYLGDGLMVHFGYPHAHEDDALHAVQTGLAITENMDLLNAEIGIDGVELAVRVGIATGPVVIEDKAADTGPEESSVVGETPNLAARLQTVAQPNHVILNEVSKRLVADRIKLENLGARTLKGISEPVPIWRALREVDAAQTLDELNADPELPLIGRQEELRLLQRAWDTSRTHGGQVAFVRGEAGVGKTRLLRALRGHTGDDTRWITIRGSAHQQSTALYPVVTHLKRLLGTLQESTGESPLMALEVLLATCRQVNQLEAVPLLAEILSIPVVDSKYSPLDMTSDQRRESVLDILNEWIASEAESAPLVVAWEDLHWTDPTTFRMMELLIDQIPTMPILLVGTHRSDFELPISPRSYGTSISINRLAPSEVEQIVGQIAGGKTLPREVLDHIVEKSDGVPLFVEELTKTILESNVLTQSNGGYELSALTVETQIPSTLQDSLMARLDRVPYAKRIAQIGAVLGREFSYEVLASVAGVGAEDLEKGLGHLIQNEILYQRGRPPRSRYFFKHALIQDAAYQCLLRRDRRKVHHHVADVLGAQFPDIVANAPELLAHHLTEAEEFDNAAVYWQRAGERASEQSAYLEAIDHFDRALAALNYLEENPDRIVREVKLNFLQGAAYFMTKGHGAPEVEEAYSRARALCDHVENAPDTFPVLSGLWRCFVMRPELETACDLGEQLLRVAEREQSPEQLVVARCAAGINAFYIGEFDACVALADKSHAKYQLRQRDEIMFRAGTDPAVLDGAYSSWALWLLGYPDKAIARTLQMQDHAQITEHPFSVAAADCYAAVTFQMMRDSSRARSYAERAIELSEKRGFKFWWAYGTVQRGWALAWEGRLTEGIARIREGIAQQRAGGAAIKVPFWMGLLAEALLSKGEVEEALAVSKEALELMAMTGDRFAEAELLRIKGEALLREESDAARAESVFEASLKVARAQKARGWELRTALSLARHWSKQGNAKQGSDLLLPIMQSTEGGRATYDLREAATFPKCEQA